MYRPLKRSSSGRHKKGYKKLKYDTVIDMAEPIRDIKYYLIFAMLLFCFILLYYISWIGSAISIIVSSFNS